LTLGLAALGAQAQPEDCEKPWVVVVKKDGSISEGPLVRDIQRGVVLRVDGKSTLIPEEDIEEVIEQCDHDLLAAPLKAAAAPPATGLFRTNTVEFGQRVMRFTGSGCLTLGCGLASTGMVSALGYMLNGFVQAQNSGQTSPQPQVFQLAGVFLAGFGGAAAVALGSGAGLFVVAALLDPLKAPPAKTASLATTPADDAAGRDEPAAKAAPRTAVAY